MAGPNMYMLRIESVGKTYPSKLLRCIGLMTGIPVFICLKTWVLVYAIREYFTLKVNLND